MGGLLNGNAQHPSLKFNKDGKFKIVQFTDVHYIYENPKSAISIERINEVLDAEKPDLVLFTGDVIYGKPAEEGMRKVLKLASDETAILVGTRKEKACAPQLNSGLFASMKEMGDIQGVFVGHDHDDDYAVYWKGILLAYGRYTGGNTVYNNLTNGARVIEMTEGENGFKTWIRLKDNEIINKVNYPSDFIKKKD